MRVEGDVSLSILVVDDDPTVCHFLTDFLVAENYRVETLSDPSLAVERVREGKYHICIVDLMIPELSGVDLIKNIRTEDSDVALVVLTAYPSLETASAVMPHEVSAYVRKPFDNDEFRALLRNIADKKGLLLRREDELQSAIGQTIRELRKDRGLTLKQMARRTDLSVSLLSQIERAESSASVETLFRVATALDVRLTHLFGGF